MAETGYLCWSVAIPGPLPGWDKSGVGGQVSRNDDNARDLMAWDVQADWSMGFLAIFCWLAIDWIIWLITLVVGMVVLALLSWLSVDPSLKNLSEMLKSKPQIARR